MSSAVLRRLLRPKTPKLTASSCHSFCSPDCHITDLCPSPPPLLRKLKPPLPPFPKPKPPPTAARHVIPIAAAAAIATTTALLIIIAICALLRFRRRRLESLTLALADGGDAEELAGDGGEHHVWYIRTAGLDEVTIAAIAAWAYKAGDGVLDEGDAECAVCLAEFREGEVLRMLPKCGHSFHMGCVDVWLRSHVNCPLCRAPILAVKIVDGCPGGGDLGRNVSDFGGAGDSMSSDMNLSNGVSRNVSELVEVPNVDFSDRTLMRGDSWRSESEHSASRILSGVEVEELGSLEGNKSEFEEWNCGMSRSEETELKQNV